MDDLDSRDVERFYARQRAEIAARIASDARATGARRARARWLAAAVLAGVAMLSAWRWSDRPAPTTGTHAEHQLEAYGPWTPLDPAREPGALGSLTWLLDADGTTAPRRELPDFLEPFGSWETGDPAETI